ncbi:hypothetical protein PRZ48_004812 [Zasmidium cellare]|uniref:Histone H2A/H2B/H3 domain-containing protein n=1 Tax=Zasmidium cellare TaxID=395010 RepID=A0ABR0EQK0_ZASCE|nr:hypothetical protein PRZ48_004812 [Zasmidium cellare]
MAREKRTAHRFQTGENDSSAASTPAATVPTTTSASTIDIETFMQLVTEITQEIDTPLDIEASIIEPLYAASEAVVREMFEELSMLATHAGRVMIIPQDYKVAKVISTSQWADLARSMD